MKFNGGYSILVDGEVVLGFDWIRFHLMTLDCLNSI